MNLKHVNIAIFTGLCLFLLPGIIHAQGKIDIQALTQETQKMSQEQSDVTLVWWIPEQFWQASFSQNPQMTQTQVDDFLKTVRPYTMIVVINGSMGPFGGVTYKAEEEIRSSLKIKDANGQTYSPLTENAVDQDTKNFLQMMKPMFSSMLGPMGQNMHFVLFPSKTANGASIADAGKKGSFSVMLADKEFKWRLPLDSLLPAKKCPSCKEDCKGSWSFCPWCGTKLPVPSTEK